MHSAALKLSKARPVRMAMQQGGALLKGTEGIYSIGFRFGYPRTVGRSGSGRTQRAEPSQYCGRKGLRVWGWPHHGTYDSRLVRPVAVESRHRKRCAPAGLDRSASIRAKAAIMPSMQR